MKVVGKTTRGSAVPRNLSNFSTLLNHSFTDMENETPLDAWHTGSLDHLANKTLFKTIFNSIFGEDKQSPTFNYELYHDNFKVFHKYFSYLWIGLPHMLFPDAKKAIAKLAAQPSSAEFLKSECTSEYLKSAIEFLKGHDMTDAEITSHNLVFLHINLNTFKVATWCLYQLMNHKSAMYAVREELENFIQANKQEKEGDTDVTYISAKEIEEMESLGK